MSASTSSPGFQCARQSHSRFLPTKVIAQCSPRKHAASPCHAAAYVPNSGGGDFVFELVKAVAAGQLEVNDATQKIESLQANGAVQSRRRALSVEVLSASGMPAAQLATALENLARHQHTASARHVQSEVYATIRTMLPGVRYHAGAGMLLYTDPTRNIPNVQKLPGHVVIVCGSGVDVQMAYESKVALGLMGAYATMMRDVTPTKLDGLLSQRAKLSAADAVIVCCSEQPSLGGLVASLVDVPVVAIPGINRPDPTQSVAMQGLSTVAPGDGVSAASVCARTLHIAAQYIQHRKDRLATQHADDDDVYDEGRHLDREPVVDLSSHSNQPFKPVFNGVSANGNNGNGSKGFN